MNAGRIEPAATDRDFPTRQMGSHRAAIHSEPGCQLDECRAVTVLRHQFVDLVELQKGLSHLK
jgi:hypothetical protein